MPVAREKPDAEIVGPQPFEKLSVIVLAHGSRDASSEGELHILLDDFRARHPLWDIRHAYVELAEPLLRDLLAAGPFAAERVVVVPLMLFASGHVKNDLPLALADARRAHPQQEFLAARPLGVHPSMTEVLDERVAEVGLTVEAKAQTSVILVGRGSSDPDANSDFCKLARLFAEGRGFARVEPTFMGITEPRVPATLDHLARLRATRILIVPYLLLTGRLLTRLDAQLAQFQEAYPWIPAQRCAHLGWHSKIVDLLDARIDEALRGTAPLPCDTCKYRHPLPGFTRDVGGLRALLYSVRHAATHAQTGPAVHAHRPIKRHVLVCGNVDCAEKGSVVLLRELRRLAKEKGRAQEIRVTRTSCMGRCGEGPTLVVYPDGVWYRGVRKEDASELFEQHLEGDRLVGRLLDDVMQSG